MSEASRAATPRCVFGQFVKCVVSGLATKANALDERWIGW